MVDRHSTVHTKDSYEGLSKQWYCQPQGFLRVQSESVSASHQPRQFHHRNPLCSGPKRVGDGVGEAVGTVVLELPLYVLP